MKIGLKEIAQAFFTFALTVSILQSCEKENGNETKISAYNSDESHNSGQNCMNCHVEGGGGEGWFTIAGTVYDSTLNSSHPNALVEFHTGPNNTGTYIVAIQVDALGNFYTTKNVVLKDGLYPSVVGNSKAKSMAGTITTGQCNQCHGVTTPKIWIN